MGRFQGDVMPQHRSQGLGIHQAVVMPAGLIVQRVGFQRAALALASRSVIAGRCGHGDRPPLSGAGRPIGLEDPILQGLGHGSGRTPARGVLLEISRRHQEELLRAGSGHDTEGSGF